MLELTETSSMDYPIIFIDEVGSTNSYATNLLKHNQPSEGTCILTANQTKGRGMADATWIFVPGHSFAASWIFYPAFLSAGKAYFLYVIASLAVHDVLSCTGELEPENLFIKWPNDLIYKQKKICGILIENQWSGEKIKSSVIGMGINLSEHPLLSGFSSLLADGKIVQSEELFQWAENLGNRLLAYYEMLKKGASAEMEKKYYERLYGFAKSITFRKVQSGEIREGLVEGIDSSGRLVVRTNDKKEFFMHKELIQIL